MRQSNIIDGDGNVETFKMFVVSDGPRENFNGRARHFLVSTNANGNRGQVRTKEGVVGKK